MSGGFRLVQSTQSRHGEFQSIAEGDGEAGAQSPNRVGNARDNGRARQPSSGEINHHNLSLCAPPSRDQPKEKPDRVESGSAATRTLTSSLSRIRPAMARFVSGSLCRSFFTISLSAPRSAGFRKVPSDGHTQQAAECHGATTVRVSHGWRASRTRRHPDQSLPDSLGNPAGDFAAGVDTFVLRTACQCFPTTGTIGGSFLDRHLVTRRMATAARPGGPVSQPGGAGGWRVRWSRALY